MLPDSKPQLPDLKRSLKEYDLGHLRIIAEFWGLELEAPEARTGLGQLASGLLEPELVSEMIEALPPDSQKAITELVENNGCVPSSVFSRRYGNIREMGPARREREQPYRSTDASPAEWLWYRGLIARAFFETSMGSEEFVYIPNDLLDLIPLPRMERVILLGRPATPAECALPLPADDSILDDSCTLLAALRIGLSPDKLVGLFQCAQNSIYPLSPGELMALLHTAGLLDENELPIPEPTRDFLEAERGEALLKITRAWLKSEDLDELRWLPGLSMEGEWRNDPVRTRETVLGFISSLPLGSPEPEKRRFWSLSSFLAAVKEEHPDFQRPAGDYDSWYIREEESGEFLRGFDNWDEVDGATIRYIIAGPAYWLGIFDLAMPEVERPERIITAFRFSDWGADLIEFKPPLVHRKESEPMTVRSDGRVRVPLDCPRSGRYQIARFCRWDGFKDGFFRYQLTPASLQRAREQGLQVPHLLSILNHHAAAVPPSLVKAIQRWATRGSEARLENFTVLRLKDPESLKALRESRAVRFLGDPLGPTAVIVNPGAGEKVLAALAEMGILGEMIE